MKVEILIYAYLAVCAAMILFNIVCIFIFRKKDTNIEKRSSDYSELVEKQLEHGYPDEEHKEFLRKKLRSISRMMAFDETLEKLYAARPEETRAYISDLSSVFVFLTFQYHKKDNIRAAYFPYIIKKYQVFKGEGIAIVVDAMLELVREDNLYCRENALQALYSIGDADSVVKALKILDQKKCFHHTKMIADGLLTFTGDKTLLDKRLWQQFEGFSITLKQSILDYFRFSGNDHSEKMLEIMTNRKENQELRFCAIRYFAKHSFAPALPHLYNFATENNPIWEYKAISASSLGNFPSEETVQLLKGLLCDKNWHVRYNAADSLERLQVDYEKMIDIFEGKDRYAAEMLRYRFDRKKLKETEA